MKPYYERDGVTIYHGDCREILPHLDPVDSIVTDPVWPNSSPSLVGAERPFELLAEAAAKWPRVCQRAIVHLGCDSDPRILSAIPEALPFLRVLWLEYACPTHKGRILYNGDVAYLFGVPAAARPGHHLLPGVFISTRPDGRRVRVTKHKDWGAPNAEWHPTPRRFEHVAWMMRFVAGTVLDPFCGSGTTLEAARRAGYPAVGIEIEERYCEMAARRFDQGIMAMTVPARPASADSERP